MIVFKVSSFGLELWEKKHFGVTLLQMKNCYILSQFDGDQSWLSVA